MAPSSDFSATCPGCQATYRVPLSMAGLLVTCESCQADFVLPDSAKSILTPPVPYTPPARGTFLKNALLLLSGAAVVWGVSLYLNPPPAGETVVAPGEPASPAESMAVPPPPEVFTSVNKRRPALPTPIPAPAPTAPPVPEPIAAPAPAIPPGPPSPPVIAASPPPAAPPAEIAAVLPASSPATPPTAPQVDPTKLRKDSRLTLERFLRASTLDERLAVSQNPDKVRPAMEEHYRTHPMGPVPLEEIAFLTEGEVPDTKRKFHLYNVSLRDQEAPIPMAVEDTEDGYRVDWPTFTECYTHRLRDFSATPSEAPGLFRVMLRRAHYFGPPVPGQDTIRIAYTVEPPGRDDSFHVWVDKDSLVYKEKLAKGDRAGWSAESYVIVELIWRGDDTKGRWVSLRRITNDSWRAE